MQTAIAHDGAFSISPDDLVAYKTADPDEKTYNILDRQQPPLLLRYGIVNNVAGCGQRRDYARAPGRSEVMSFREVSVMSSTAASNADAFARDGAR